MAKKSTPRPAQGATVNTAPDTSIPPVYSMRPAGAPPNPKPDMARGALTEGKAVVDAFGELILEGKAGQYLLLERARMGNQHRYPIIRDNERQRPSPQLLLKERDGVLGYNPNRDLFPVELQEGDRYGATYHRVTRTLKWTATIYRIATEDERAISPGDLASRKDHTAQDLLDYTRKTYTKGRIPSYEVPEPEKLRRFRTDMLGLPDMSETELLEHYRTRPLPLWYTQGVWWDNHPATGPHDPRHPVGTIHGAFVATDRNATDHEEWTRWIDEFAVEVEVCVERFKEHEELPHELARMIAAIRAFEIGSGEAGPYIADLRTTSAGQRIMDAMNDGKARLLRRLGTIAEEWPVDAPGNGSVTATPERPLERIAWNDTAALLAFLLNELIEADYITPPPNGRRVGRDGNRAAVADMAYRIFDIRDRATGNRVTREYFRSLMRPSSPDRDSRGDLFRIRSRTASNEPT